jgi:hypothetical protein
MRTVQRLAHAGLAILALGMAASAWPINFRSVAYALDTTDAQTARFTCTDASDGVCFVKTGAANGALSQSFAVKVGTTVAIAMSDQVDTLCYSADDALDWPACATGGLHLDLREPRKTTGQQTYFGKTFN